MRADREKRAMILTAEGQRESAISSAEGQKQAQILSAEGAKQAAILAAEADRQSRMLRAQGERAAQYLQAQGQAKAIEKTFAAIKAGRPTPEMLAYQYLQTLPQMAKGEANKVWLVPSDFGKALEGFTKMLGAPGEDGVFRFQPSPVDDAACAGPRTTTSRCATGSTPRTDPEIARAVANAEAQARQAVLPIGCARSRPCPRRSRSRRPPGRRPRSSRAARSRRGPAQRLRPPPPSPTGNRRAPSPRRPAACPATPGVGQRATEETSTRRRTRVRRPAAAGLPVPAAPRLTALRGQRSGVQSSGVQGEPERQLQAVAGQQLGVGEQVAGRAVGDDRAVVEDDARGHSCSA